MSFLLLEVDKFTIIKVLKVVSATKQWLLKMCYLRHMLRIYLGKLCFHRKVMFGSQDVQAFVYMAIQWFTKSMLPQWVLVHETGYIFEYSVWTTTH